MNEVRKLLNPFSGVDAENTFAPEATVSTPVQRELVESCLGRWDDERFLCLIGESGMGRTHTLRTVFEIVSREKGTGDPILPVFICESFISLDSIFHRLFPDIIKRELKDHIKCDRRRFFLFVDYPVRYVKKDLVSSMRFLLGLREFPNISIILSLTTRHFNSMEGINLFFEADNLLHLDLFRKEEISAMIRKRLALFRKMRCNAGKDLTVTSRTVPSSPYRSVSFNSAQVEMTREAMEYIYAVSGGRPRLALITASTLFNKARENSCGIIDKALVELVSAQNGYRIDGSGCVLRTGLSKLMDVILGKFRDERILEHNLLTYMAEKFGWDFNITRLRLNTLVKMRLIMDDLNPGEGWFRQYSIRQ